MEALKQEAAKEAARAVEKREEAVKKEGGLRAAAASINAAVAGSGLGSSTRCVAVSADTTDDWCQNA